MANVTLDQANTIASVGFDKGRELGLQPLTIIVLDSGGHVVSAQRQDNSGILRFEIAQGKAWASLGMGRASRAMQVVAEQRPAFINALSTASGGRFIPVIGGVLITDDGGAIIGAVGVSGDTSENDEACALAGIEAAGLGAKLD